MTYLHGCVGTGLSCPSSLYGIGQEKTASDSPGVADAVMRMKGGRSQMSVNIYIFYAAGGQFGYKHT